MRIETIDRRNLSEADARDCVELLVAIWPKPGRTVETWTPDVRNQWKDYRGPDEEYPRMFVIRESGRVIAQASADPRTIGTSAGEITVLALSRVCTDPAVRGRKLGQAVVRKAFDLVDQGPFRFALFQTTEQVRPFYEALGAVKIENRFVNSQADVPTAHPWWNPIIMCYPAAPGWPTGEIDLHGPGW
jgi:predicted GNAT family N-acyltransferase